MYSSNWCLLPSFYKMNLSSLTLLTETDAMRTLFGKTKLFWTTKLTSNFDNSFKDNQYLARHYIRHGQYPDNRTEGLRPKYIILALSNLLIVNLSCCIIFLSYFDYSLNFKYNLPVIGVSSININLANVYVSTWVVIPDHVGLCV